MSISRTAKVKTFLGVFEPSVLYVNAKDKIHEFLIEVSSTIKTLLIETLMKEAIPEDIEKAESEYRDLSTFVQFFFIFFKFNSPPQVLICRLRHWLIVLKEYESIYDKVL